MEMRSRRKRVYSRSRGNGAVRFFSVGANEARVRAPKGLCRQGMRGWQINCLTSGHLAARLPNCVPPRGEV